MAVLTGIFYFSGTGNTRLIAELAAEKFAGRLAAAEIIKIEDVLKDTEKIDLNKYDIIGIGYPIHAFNAPGIVFDFVRRLPLAFNKRTFLFKTAGDFFINGGTTSMLRNRLRRRGYNVFSEDLFIISSNVMIKYSEDLIKQLYIFASGQVESMVQRVLSGEIKLQKNNVFVRIFCRMVSGLETLGVRFLKLHFRVSGECNFCGRCVNMCPRNNISYSNSKGKKIKFGWKCVFCMRCIYSCPKRAITIPPFNSFIIKDEYDPVKIVKRLEPTGNKAAREQEGYYSRFFDYMNNYKSFIKKHYRKEKDNV